ERTKSIAGIQLRANAFGVPVLVTDAGQGRISVVFSKACDVSRVKDIIGRSSLLAFELVASGDQLAISRMRNGEIPVPPLEEIVPTRNTAEPWLLVHQVLADADTVRDPEGRPVLVLSGAYLNLARQSFDPQTARPVVDFKLSSTGAAVFSKLTANHVGQRF